MLTYPIRFKSGNFFLRYCLLLLMILLCDSVSAAPNDSPSVLRVHLHINGKPLWEGDVPSDIRSFMNDNVFGVGLNVDSNFGIMPGYIKSWEWSEEKRAFLLKVDGRKRFHDGTFVSAYDLEFLLIKILVLQRGRIYNGRFLDNQGKHSPSIDSLYSYWESRNQEKIRFRKSSSHLSGTTERH